MIKAVGGRMFNVDTAAGKAAYTIEAIKYKKAMTERKREHDLQTLIVNQTAKCARKKLGQW